MAVPLKPGLRLGSSSSFAVIVLEYPGVNAVHAELREDPPGVLQVVGMGSSRVTVDGKELARATLAHGVNLVIGSWHGTVSKFPSFSPVATGAAPGAQKPLWGIPPAVLIGGGVVLLVAFLLPRARNGGESSASPTEKQQASAEEPTAVPRAAAQPSPTASSYESPTPRPRDIWPELRPQVERAAQTLLPDAANAAVVASGLPNPEISSCRLSRSEHLGVADTTNRVVPVVVTFECYAYQRDVGHGLTVPVRFNGVAEQTGSGSWTIGFSR
jgi:hypothetical protein